MIDPIYLTIDQVIALHDAVLVASGGLRGIRDTGLLESALDAPRAAMFGMEMYRTVKEKSAVLLFHLIKNHPFNDGNKRTAFVSWIVFCEANKIKLSIEFKILVEALCVTIAEGTISKDELIKLMLKM